MEWVKHNNLGQLMYYGTTLQLYKIDSYQVKKKKDLFFCDKIISLNTCRGLKKKITYENASCIQS